MFLSEILDVLGDCPIGFLKKDSFNTDFTGIRMLTKSQDMFLPGVLYFGPAALFPRELHANYCTNFLIYGTKEEYKAISVTDQPMNLLCLDPSVDVFLIYNQIQEIFLESQRVVTGMRLLLDALFNDEGIQGICDVAYSFLGNPIFIIDSSYHHIAVSTGTSADNDLMAKENSLGRIEEEGIQFIRQSKLDDRVRKSRRPVYIHNPVHNRGMLIGTVKIQGIEVAHVMLYEQNRKISENDIELIHRLCRIASIELQKKDFYKKNKGTMYAYFIGDLLDNNAGNIESSKERLEILGYTLKDDLFILSISDKYNTTSEAKQELIVANLQSLLPGCLYVIYQNSIIFLINGCDDHANHRFTNEALEDYLISNDLIAGLSNSFKNIQEIRKYYQQSLKSAGLGRKMKNKPGLYRYEVMSIFHILEICESQDYSLLDFCHPALLTLKAYDEEKHTDFFNTLYQYLNFSQNTQRTADYLHIHKNTLLYRIDKIKKLTGNPLNHGDELIKLHFSFKILEYMRENLEN